MLSPDAKRAKACGDDRIAVVDFGGQYAHLIAAKVRMASVKAQILQPDDPIAAFRGYAGVILSGSPSLSAKDEDSAWTKEILDLDVPILGFCFGHQEIAKRYGGTVTHGDNCEWGFTTLHIKEGGHPLFEGLSNEETVWMSHFDSVASLGDGFEQLGFTKTVIRDADGKAVEGERVGANAAIANDQLRRYGFQFHPEVDSTVNGGRMIANFALNICGCSPTWNMASYKSVALDDIKQRVGDKGVFLLCSGGVDSTVCAKLFEQALPKGKLKLLHIDNGMMRLNESAQVLEMFKELGLYDSLTFVDAADEMVAALAGVVEPEKKRKIIGVKFIEIFEREAKKMDIEGYLLGQGTIYPDTIESGGTKRAHVIKTHHNRVALIEQMIAEGKVVEPIVELYKVEVRKLAAELGVPQAMIGRHPFPGPGLGVRLLCSKGEDVVCPRAQAAADACLKGRGVSGHVLPMKSVGVKADLRSYESPVMLTAHAPTAGPMADMFEEPAWDVLLDAARVVLRDVPGVNRCVWNLAPAAPRTLKPLAAETTRARLDLLRVADDIVMRGLRAHGLYDSIWQCPTALVPLCIDGKGAEMVVVRPVITERAMTASPAQLPHALLQELRKQILALDGVSGLALDITSKPPGTIEWE